MPSQYFGGEDGFNYLQECDNIKNQYATNNNIPLIRIKYTEKDNLIPILEDFLKDINSD